MSNEDTATPARRPLPMPGMAAICLYLLLLAGIIILGVVSEQHYPPFFLFFAAVFMTASAGMTLSFRWGWVLALAAVFLLTAYNLWIFTAHHDFAPLAQGLLNLVFFLYLVRPEVRAHLR